MIRVEVLEFLKRIFDRKISDRIIRGYNAEEIKRRLGNVKEIESFKYYHYPPGAKYPADSKGLKNQSTKEVFSVLNSHFSESPNFFVEIHHRVYKSGKQEIILRGINLNGEITKIAVLNFKKYQKE